MALRRLREEAARYGRLGRDSKLLIAAGGLQSVGWGVWGSFWQLYLKEAGYTATTIGTYSLVAGILSGALMLPLGVLSDRVGRKRLYLLGYSLSTLSGLVLWWRVDLPFLMAAAAMEGMGWALSGPASNALFAEAAGDLVEEAYSLDSTIRSAGFAAGGLAGWIPEIWVAAGGTYLESYRRMVLVAGSLGLAGAIPLLPVRERFRPAPGRGGLRGLRARRVAWKFAVSSALVSFGAGMSIPLLGYYLSVKFGVESGPIGTLFTMAELSVGAAYLLSTPLSRRFGILKAIVLPQAASIPLLAAIPSAPSFAAAAALYLPRQVLMNAVNPLQSALMMRLTPEEERGSVTAVNAVAWALPNSVASQVGGLLMDRIDLDVPIYATSLTYCAYVAAFYLLFRGEVKDGARPGGRRAPSPAAGPGL